MHPSTVFKLIAGAGTGLLIGCFFLAAIVGALVGGGTSTSMASACALPQPSVTQTVQAPASTANALSSQASPVPGKTPAPTASAPSSPSDENNPCFSASPYGAQVVAWAKHMADALTVASTCGTRRTPPDCNSYNSYTSAFPKQVIQYGQDWCHAHGHCEDWVSGGYQCVSFVRGAYSQVYPMTLSNDAFSLWATYQNLSGWQEIPAAASNDVMERGLPQPGDVMIFKDDGVGHVAIVISVTAPHDGKNGEVDFANANSSSPYDHMPLLPSLLVDTSAWTNNSYQVWGYLRPKLNVSSRLVRISQLDPAQYVSHNEFLTWAYSACSTAAMTEVLNAYGFDVRIHDVLTIEEQSGSITPQLGLTAEAGIAATLHHFNLSTHWGDHWTLDQLLSTANSGTPVIVSWPPDRYAGGHIVVVLGGESGSIRIADSSSWDRQTLSTSQFLQWWGGFAAVATPNWLSTPTLSTS